ncbi:MAG: DUF447 domain-containing protein [Candidatus Hodarchaeota archaeon]
MELNYQKLGLKKDYLYEVLAITYNIFKDKIIPNTSCMGIRLIEDKLIKISPYHSTVTFKNLKLNKFISLNFVDNIYLYALASLKESHSKIGLNKFPENYYGFLEVDKNIVTEKISNKIVDSKKLYIPFINEAWGVLICEAIEEEEIVKENNLGKSILSEFNLIIKKVMKLKESYNLFNRAENLTLESIILATRLKLAHEKKDQILYSKFKGMIDINIKDVRRFGKNLNALKAIDLIEKFIKI